MNRHDLESLREVMETDVKVRKIARYKYRLNDREVDFSPAMPLTEHRSIPVWIAQNLGLLKIVKHQVVPAVFESLRHNHKKMWLFYPLATSLSTFGAITKSF
jgi:hypothetical protein